jgi:RNA polymerase sigma-70 factor (ECF subfamily)
VANDDRNVSGGDPVARDRASALLEIYDRALPQVYGYLLTRCRSATLAEDLTAETFLAAVDAVRRDAVPRLTVAWLLGVARHKLIDHWRRRSREEERAVRFASEDLGDGDDSWDEILEAERAHAVLDMLGPHHRAALTLRYLDGLPVPQVAAHLGRTLHATEALLVRARAAFRRAYVEREGDPRD